MKKKNVFKIAAMVVVITVAFLNVELVADNNPNEGTVNAVASLNFAAAQGEVKILNEPGEGIYYCCSFWDIACGKTASGVTIMGRPYTTYPSWCR